ncbi:MAG: hypothetical protein KDA37_11885 [Planctomycetales bacterium]|nr:hypothetical protein [Planctomycetales bacterium]
MLWLRDLPRRLRQCSWLSWGVFLIVGLAMMLISVPGDPVYSYSDWNGSSPSGWSKDLDEAIGLRYAAGKFNPDERLGTDQYRHGWPLPCVTRGIGRVVLRTKRAGGGGWKDVFVRGHPVTAPTLSVHLPSDGDAYASVNTSNPNVFKLIPVDWEETQIAWSSYNRWPFAIDAAKWRLDFLLIDLTLLLAIPLGLAAATEWWVRRRGGVLRFRLVDLVVAFAALSAAFAWYRSHADLRRAEQRVEAHGMAFWFSTGALMQGWQDHQQGHNAYNGYQREYLGPDWLRRLLGNQELVRFAKHIVAVQLAPNESWSNNLEVLPKLDHLRSVSLPRGATRRAIEQLGKVEGLRKLEIGIGSHAAPRKRAESTDHSKDPWIGAQDLACLRSLSIEELGLAGEEFLAEDIEQAASIPTLRRLELIEPSLTLEELERLREENPHIEIQCHWLEAFWSTASPGTQYSLRAEPPGGVERKIESMRRRREAPADSSKAGNLSG